VSSNSPGFGQRRFDQYRCRRHEVNVFAVAV